MLFTVLVIFQCLTITVFGRESLVGYGGMAASEHYLATQAGIDMLKNGGNAADAALAMQLVLNQVQPTSSGIGGGCFILYYESESEQVFAIDGREEAPNSYNGKVFCEDINCFLQNVTDYETNGECNCSSISQTISQDLSYGGLSVGVPGTLYAYYLLNKYFGSSNGDRWTDSFQSAIDIAENGFEMTQSLWNSINGNRKLASFATTANLYFNDTTSRIPKVNVGELFINQDFANTLQILSQNSDDAIEAFYHGEIAQAILDVIKTEGNYTRSNGFPRWGLMEQQDINQYKAVFRDPVIVNYGDKYKMWGMSMPSSGSITVEYMMNLLYYAQNNNITNNNLSDFQDGMTLKDYNIYSDVAAHYLYTANNIAFADRNKYMADSDFIDVPIEGLSDLDYIKQRFEEFMSDTLVETPIDFGIPPGLNKNEEFGKSYEELTSGTSHFFVIDKDNNLACITTTIESGWGSGLTVPNYGFLLNNELTDFQRFGYDENQELIANSPQGGKKQRITALDIFDLNDTETFGGKRPRSSMSPIIVTDIDGSKPIFAVGSPGGSYIISTTFNVLSKLVIYDMDVQKAIDSARLWAFNDGILRWETQRGWTLNNSNLTIDLENDRGYTSDSVTFSSISNGRCSALRINEPSNDFMIENGFYSFEGGADDLRRSESSVMTLCSYDNSENNPSICGSQIIDEQDNELTGLQLGFIIGGSLVVFIAVIAFSMYCFVSKRKKSSQRQYIDMAKSDYGATRD